MDIPKHIIEEVTKDIVQIGEIYKITMSHTDGITPKNGYTTRDKYFVVLGYDDKGNIFGGVVVNSELNPKLPASITDYYMPIPKTKYPFLKYDSFVNCTTLKTTTAHKLLEGEQVGQLTIEDIDLVRCTIIDSPHETPIRLKRFGLL